MAEQQAEARAGTGRILVIKHAALGDFIQACGPFAAIRRYHADRHITLMTTPTFADLGAASGYFDAVWIDDRPSWRRPLAWWRLRRKLLAGRFARVYDLQTSDRTAAYFHVLPRARRPEWSGHVAGCSHRHVDPARDSMHTIDRQAAQLRAAGINAVPPPDMSWLRGDVDAFLKGGPCALLVPGSTPNRPEKRWPGDSFAALAEKLTATGLVPFVIGTANEAALMDRIAAAVPGAVNLCGRTSLGQIASLARAATVAIGNDTGPMHIIAQAGCPSLVLFSAHSDPALCAPRGANVTVLRGAPLSDVSVAAVWRQVEPWAVAA